MDVKSEAARGHVKARRLSRAELRLPELAASAAAGFVLAGARVFGGTIRIIR